MTTNHNNENKLQQLADATEEELSSLLPSVRNRILNRIRMAYWLGAADGMLDVNQAPVGEDQPA